MKKLVIFDRDGCINYSAPEGEYVCCAEDFKIYPDAIVALNLLIRMNLNIAIATNQRGVALGLYTEKLVMEMHERLIAALGVEPNRVDLFICPHDKGQCDCRKPLPGLLISALEKHDVKVGEALFIGDSESDYLAASALGMDFVFLNRSSKRVNIQSKQLNSLTEIVLLFEEISR